MRKCLSSVAPEPLNDAAGDQGRNTRRIFNPYPEHSRYRQNPVKTVWKRPGISKWVVSCYNCSILGIFVRECNDLKHNYLSYEIPRNSEKLRKKASSPPQGETR